MKNKNEVGCLQALFSGLLIFGTAIFIITIVAYKFLSLLGGERTVQQSFSGSFADSTKPLIQREFVWRYVDEDLRKYYARFLVAIPESEIKQAFLFMRKLSSASYDELGLTPLSDSEDSLHFARELWLVIYKKVLYQSKAQFASLNNRLQLQFSKANLTQRERFMYLTTCVQNIKYQVPEDELGLLPPIGALANRFGDCDTKALLLYVLLEAQGIDCVLMWSGYYTHAMLGVQIPASGEGKRHAGQLYYFLEVTSPDWLPGQLPPDVNNPEYWYVFDLDER